MKKTAWQLTYPIQAVIFDCDGTLSHIEGVDELADMNGVGEEVKALTDYAMSHAGITKELFQQRMNLIKPSRQQVDKIGAMYYEKRTTDIDAVIEVLKSLNKEIYIVSAGLNPAVKDFAKKLNIPEGNVFAVNTFFDEQGGYVNYDHEAYTANKDGKRFIVELLKKRYDRILYVGDGMNDMPVYDLVDRFVGYGGFCYRENIASKCEFYINTPSMLPLLSLSITKEEVEKLNPETMALYDAGLRLLNPSNKKFRIRSYVRREGRKTEAQVQALEERWPQFGLSLADGMLNLSQVFANDAPVLLEIGFGMGQSLLAAAKENPDKNFIGVETHKPGVGALLLGMQLQEVNNIRIFHTDVIDVLEQCIPDASLSGVQIFFPDPWQKRKHHPRRLIQSEFLKLILRKLKMGAELHLATDWDDYAKHMMKVVTAESGFENVAGASHFAARSPYRPIISKFENRAIKEGRQIWELRLRCK